MLLPMGAIQTPNITALTPGIVLRVAEDSVQEFALRGFFLTDLLGQRPPGDGEDY